MSRGIQIVSVLHGARDLSALIDSLSLDDPELRDPDG